MQITKFGHSCLLVEEGGVRILTDPGLYSTQQNNITNIDLILITHDHKDHLDIDSLKQVISNNPGVIIVTNSEVGKTLEKENIKFQIIENGQKFNEKGISIEGFGDTHALIHSSLVPAQNTGYLIANKLFCPGDALTVPTKPVEILALPTAGPWLKISESIDYAIEVRPKICFPIHDASLKSPGSIHIAPQKVLEPLGIKFIVIDIDQTIEF